MKTLQLILYNFLNESKRIARLIQEGGSMRDAAAAVSRSLTPKGVQVTVTVVAVVPILLVYPYMQRYFAKGIMVGAIKG